MYNKDTVISMFVRNEVISWGRGLKGSHIYCYYTGDLRVLVNYSTPIAIIENNTLYINKNKYSQTTTRNQNKIRYYANIENMNIIESSEEELRKMI